MPTDVTQYQLSLRSSGRVFGISSRYKYADRHQTRSVGATDSRSEHRKADPRKFSISHKFARRNAAAGEGGLGLPGARQALDLALQDQGDIHGVLPRQGRKAEAVE